MTTEFLNFYLGKMYSSVIIAYIFKELPKKKKRETKSITLKTRN